MKKGDLVRTCPSRLAIITRVMFSKIEVKRYGITFEVSRKNVEVLNPNQCEICGEIFDEDDIKEFTGPYKTQLVCCDCLVDVEADAAADGNDCPTCGGSGGGPEHWRCTSCKGSGVIKRSRSADDYEPPYEPECDDSDPYWDYYDGT